MTSRKVVKKAIQKAIIDLKAIEISPFNKDNETTAIVSMLREVQAITHAIFKSLLSFISGAKSQSRSSFFFQQNQLTEEESQLNEFTRVDASLNLFVTQKMKKSDNFLVEDAQNLEELASCIQDLDEELESLFRHLIKTRVSLLKILNH